MEWGRQVNPLTLEATAAPFPKRLDTCDCERLLKCPNGTKIRATSGGADDITDCVKTGEQVLRRASVIPQSAAAYKWWGERYDKRREFDSETGLWTGADMFLRNHSAFTELSGADDLSVGTLFLRTFETAVMTLDLRSVAANLTYDEHYRIAVYVDCKPCPTGYACNYEQEPPTCSQGPSVREQQLNLESCLAKRTKKVCLTATGNFTDCDAYKNSTKERGNIYSAIPFQTLSLFKANSMHCIHVKIVISIQLCSISHALMHLNVYFLFYSVDPCVVEYYEGDLHLCQQVPYFCDDTPRYKQNWRIPMEYCRRVGDSPVCRGRSYRDSSNNFASGKTAVDFELLADGLTTQEVFATYQGWIESFATFNYECNVTIDDPSSANYGRNSNKVAAEMLEASSFEHSLKPFLEPPLGLDDVPQLERMVTGCCACEPHSMPEFFNQNAPDPGFYDNKHTKVQLAVSALKDTEITVCFELQHGQYLPEFEVIR